MSTPAIEYRGDRPCIQRYPEFLRRIGRSNHGQPKIIVARNRIKEVDRIFNRIHKEADTVRERINKLLGGGL